jgi:hypothetical protein
MGFDLKSMERNTGFWQSTPLAAKWALVAAVVLLIVTVVPFVVMTVIVSIGQHLSPTTVVFGPMPGNPLVVWLYYTAPAAAFQLATALALRHSRPGVLVAGIVGALTLTAAALAWLGAMAYAGVQWLLVGTLAGDYYDLLGIVFFGAPVLIVIAGLNARAGYLGMGELLARKPTPVAR